MTITPESVKTLLTSPDLGSRLSGLNQLRQLPKNLAFELVQISIKDSNTRVRYAAVSQMDTLGAENLELSSNILRQALLDDPEPDVQAAAADAIGALKLTKALPDLQDLYHQTSEWLVQFSIIAALGELGTTAAIPLLTEALSSPISLVQMAAIGSIGELGAIEGVELLIPFVDNSDWQIRHRVAQALGRIGGQESQNLLNKLANDEVESVAKEAQSAINS